MVLLIPVLVKASGGVADGLEGFVESSGTFAEASFLSVIIAFFSLAWGIVLVLGAARMFDLQSGPLALFAAVLAVLPLAVGLPTSLPFGIWALLLPSRRDMRTAFAGWNAESQRDQMKKESAAGRMMVVGMLVGLAMGVAVDHDRMAVYMALGMVVGLLLGWGIDANKRRKSKD